MHLLTLFPANDNNVKQYENKTTRVRNSIRNLVRVRVCQFYLNIQILGPKAEIHFEFIFNITSNVLFLLLT